VTEAADADRALAIEANRALAIEADRALAIEDIRRLVFAYPENSDTGDVDAVGRMFDGARMGHFEVPEADLPVVPGDAFADVYRRSVIYYPDGLSHAKHLITNVDIELAPDWQEARAHSYFVVLQARPELPLQVICTGRYDDTLRRIDGQWKVAVRRECMDIKGDLRFHVREPGQLEATPSIRFEPYRPDTNAPPAPGGDAGPPPFDRAGATEQIRRIILSYPQRVDRGDFAAVGELLDGVKFGGAVGRKAPPVPEEELETRTAEEIEDLYRASVVLYDGIPHTKHLITNIDIGFSPDGRSASTRSYYTVLQGMESFPLQIIIAGRYDDQFREADGEWRLEARREYTDLVGDLSRHVSPETLSQLSVEG
jgi:3-phenylpropionate/cinnamic acid dioxygenase small subunit